MRVSILMGTRDGARFLGEQLGSIASQSIDNIDLIVSDDASSDATLEILAQHSGSWRKGNFDIILGPAEGFAANYRSLLTNGEVRGDYIAMSDQDDVWDQNKLEVAIRWLEKQGKVPALYSSRTRYTNSNGQFMRLSPRFFQKPAFGNALVQNIAGANTMVMNRPAFDLVAKATKRSAFVAHDWGCYLLVSGAGGIVFYDPVPHVNYRQHDNNIIGANDRWIGRIGRIKSLMNGRFSDWMDINLTALQSNTELLSDEAIEQLDSFCQARKGNLKQRIRAFRRSGVYRQTRPSQAALWIALITNNL